MTNDLEIAQQNSIVPMDKHNTYTIHQSGSGTNIGTAQTVENTTITILLPIQEFDSNGIQKEISKTINLEYFNLFIITGEQYVKPYFIVDIKKALTVKEGTNQDIHNRLATFTDEAKNEIISYPCIFATENNRDTLPNSRTQTAQYGFITDIKQLTNGDLKIYFQKLPSSIPQNVLNESLVELDIKGNNVINEFDNPHWAIKNVNIVEVLKEKGIPLWVQSI